MSLAADDAPVETPSNPHADEVLAALAVLRGVGMGLAVSLTPAVADGLSAAEAALAYSRIARAMRLTCVLELRVAGEAAQQQAAQANARRQAERAARIAAHEAGYAAKQDCAIPVEMILNEVRESGQLSEAEHQVMVERLETWTEDEDHELGFDALGQAEIFDAICQALEITPDPTLWAAGQLVEAIEAGLRATVVSARRAPAPGPQRDPFSDSPGESPRLLELADP